MPLSTGGGICHSPNEEGIRVRVIPVDATRLKVLVVGEPTAQVRDGQAVLDRTTNQPLWNLDVTVIGEGRAETIQLALPEGGFPKGLGIGAVVVPEQMVAVAWEKNGRSGVMVRARALKVDGGQAGLKGVAAA
jgi:hypothetical protein